MKSEEVIFPIGVSDFQKLRKQNLVYVDKSWLIHDIIRSGAEVLFLPRPRRFGKTLNLSMLRYFFEKPQVPKKKESSKKMEELYSQKALESEQRNLFHGLQIEKSEVAWNHFAQYPVILITFKDIEADSWDECFVKTRQLLASLYQEHRALLDIEVLEEEEKQVFKAILTETATLEQCSTALFHLSKQRPRFSCIFKEQNLHKWDQN